jgi:hypothetical protein
MTPRRIRACLCATAWCAIAGAVAARAAGPDVRVRASLDRTAIWVADRVTYTIELTCANGVDVVADDLSRDKLKVDGLEVIASETDRQSGPGGTTIYQVRYQLTTYRTDGSMLTIAPFTVRYARTRAGQRLEDAPPAGDVQVPGATIALRSVLPDDAEPSGIRSDRPPHARPVGFAELQSIGLGLILVSAVPALLAIAGLVRAGRRPRVRRSTRVVRHEERATLDAARALDPGTIEGRREVFTHLDTLVRRHLRDVWGVPGASLTPQEVPAALAATAGNASAELIASVLVACELARYAPPDAIPSAAACRQVVDQVDQLIAETGRRRSR